MFPVVAKEISFFVASQLLFPSGLYPRRLFPLVSAFLMRWTSSWDSRVSWLETRVELSSFQLISFSHIHPRRSSPLRWSHLVQLEWWKRCNYPLQNFLWENLHSSLQMIRQEKADFMSLSHLPGSLPLSSRNTSYISFQTSFALQEKGVTQLSCCAFSPASSS